jgi:hypothetical protein
VSENKRIYLLDRSGGELDDDCGMAFFWNRVWHPPGSPHHGIVDPKESVYLKIGREIHEDLAMIADMKDLRPEAIQERVDDLTKDLTDEDRIDQAFMETLYRRAGWLAGFALFIEPKLREQFDTVFMEDEIILDREPLWIPVTPDRVLRSKATGKLHYREYKSTVSTSSGWMNQWTFAIQLHLGMKALEEELGEPVEYAQIQALSKGYIGANGLSHPYVYGWHNPTTNEWTQEYKAGNAWNKRGVWEHPGGVVKWVQKCGEGAAFGVFPCSAPVFLNVNMLDSWVARKTARMKEIDHNGEACIEHKELRKLVFEQRTKKCRPPFGDPCPYLKLCWNAPGEARAAQDYIPRIPHHEIENIWREDQKKENAQ